MVFCCIAIVAFAIMYFCFLTIRQLFSGPSRDKQYPGRVPPRAILGNGALPVYGHTRLFTKWGGNVALLFAPDLFEWSGLNSCCWGSRQLGLLYSIFIWGQWRVVVQGADRVQQILQQPSLKEGWPWTPPMTLLGKSCLDLLQPADAEVLANFLQATLRPSEVMCYAPAFAEAAENNLQYIVNRKGHQTHNSNHGKTSRQSSSGTTAWSDPEDEDKIVDDKTHKIKWEALRSYTLDLMDGPILNMHMWSTPPSKETGNKSKPECDEDCKHSDAEMGLPEDCEFEKPQKQPKRSGKQKPDRHLALLWMERIKAGLCVIKLTFGAEWMQIWRMNEYGRALNARRNIESMISDHVVERVKDTPTSLTHAPGHFIHDWLTAPFPLLTLTENLLHKREGILGDGKKSSRPMLRQRSKSDSMIISAFRSPGWEDEEDELDLSEKQHPALNTEQDLAAPLFESPPRSSKKLKAKLSSIKVNISTENFLALGNEGQDSDGKATPISFFPAISAVSFSFEPSSEQPVSPVLSDVRQNQQNGSNFGFATPPPLSLPSKQVSEANVTFSSPPQTRMDDNTNPCIRNSQKPPLPLLDRIILQEEREGKGISQATITEVCILLWMVMDAGNAWTAMALSLISSNEEARTMVRDELDYLVQLYGREQLFTPIVLARMKHLDALVYEAIRLCPPFLGGMKVTQETAVFADLDLQVPKNCNVFFCQPTHENFDLANAVGKRPEMLGFQYPCAELFGFLPLKGLEVPLMVLQTKVFLAVLLQRFSPYVSKRRTFIRRVTQALTCSIRHGDCPEECTFGNKVRDETESGEYGQLESMDPTSPCKRYEITQSDAMRLFTKIPFPEPRRVIHIRERDGVQSFEPTTPSLV